MENHQITLLVIGDKGVGKTSLLKKDSSRTQETVGIDLIIEEYVYHGEKIKIKIWDTQSN